MKCGRRDAKHASSTVLGRDEGKPLPHQEKMIETKVIWLAAHDFFKLLLESRSSGKHADSFTHDNNQKSNMLFKTNSNGITKEYWAISSMELSDLREDIPVDDRQTKKKNDSRSFSCSKTKWDLNSSEIRPASFHS